jgi:hypothetical protein
MANLTEAIVGDWLDRYIQAWHTYDETQISDLFTEDAEYHYHPGDDPVVGREAIVESWQQETDPPGTWEAEYSPWLVEGDRAIATGWTRYADGQRYWNMFQLVFRDGKCSSFIEWYMTPREEI